ncbi:MAG: LUD domain-containing protein [Chloroflexota bacterium]
MTNTAFRQKIREKIADSALQAALDANAQRRVQGRIAAFESLPDWRERRQRAHAVRADVIARLDDYLDQFIAKVTGNGLTVHRAKDAAEARQIALEIIENSPQKISGNQRGSASRLIAKSKSMVSEEIELNHALEAAGHRVVETDLGEYIIQLRGEKPSHIITPAVHLRRHEVGALFHEKLGIPYTEDIPTLTNTARKMLREVFLTADVGVSGVNFGVAESGTLTLVTNEGNGRMVTTLPPVHIALMGIERLVPTLDDLALMLSLLPRSATTQKISVYTQLIQRPERDQQKHLILVDNGRSALRASSLAEVLYCIRCGACLNACPVFRELGGHAYLGADGSIAPYPGPIGSVVSPGLLGKNYVQLAQASSLCGACKDACPVDIDLPMLLTRVRAGAASKQSSVISDQSSVISHQSQGEGLPPLLKFGLRTYTRLATHPGLFAVSQRLAGLGARLVSPLSRWMKFPAFTGWGYSKDFPRPALKPFRAAWQKAEDSRAAALPKEERRKEERAASPNPHSGGFPPPMGRVARFTAELAALGGHVTKCTALELSGHLLSFLRERGIECVQAWESVPGVNWADITGAGISVEKEADESIKAGVTGALAGIAETGTLVIPGGAGRPLTASLLPEIHIAVLRASDIVPNLETAIQLPGVVGSPATALVSGPSRTADIEMTLTIGVHGPGELHVFLLE